MHIKSEYTDRRVRSIALLYLLGENLVKIISALIILALSSLTYSIQNTSFPSELLGKWSPEIENCAAEFSYFDPDSKYSATRNMVISEKQVMFCEGARVRSASCVSQNERLDPIPFCIIKL